MFGILVTLDMIDTQISIMDKPLKRAHLWQQSKCSDCTSGLSWSLSTCHQAKIAICCQTPLVAPIAQKTFTRGFSTCLIQICYQIWGFALWRLQAYQLSTVGMETFVTVVMVTGIGCFIVGILYFWREMILVKLWYSIESKSIIYCGM